MPHHVGANTDFHQNQLLGARLEALTALPAAPRQGRFFYVSGALTGYDGVSFDSHPAMATVLGATTLAQYRMLPGLNLPESIVGLWTFAPSQTGSTSVGLLTVPPLPSVPQAIGGFKPFLVSGQSRIYTGFDTPPDTDGAGDLAQPAGGLKRYVPNWVQHLGSDLVDGYHATVVVTPYGIPVRVAGGHLRVPLDPLDVDHATSRQYVDRRHGQLRSRTAVSLRTTGPLPAYTYAAGAATYTATANGPLVVDGATVTVGQRIMVAEETNPIRNWIMRVSAAGSGAAPWVLIYVGDLNGQGELDPDGRGPYDYGDYFQVTGGAASTGTTWVMSGSPQPGGGGQPPPGEEVFFNLLQLSPPLSEGHGITIQTGKVHFWKPTYPAVEFNTFPYLKADLDGQSALGSMGMYGASPAYALKSTLTNRMPKRASDAGAVFQDSGVADDGVSFYPAVVRTSGTLAFPWSELWATPASAGVKLSNVYGNLGSTQLHARSWASFTSDLATDLNLGLFALKATTITINGTGGIVVTGGTQSLASNSLWTVGFSTIPSQSVSLPAGAVGYGNPSNQLTGDAALFYFNGVYAGIAGKLVVGSVASGTHRVEFAPGSTTVAPIRFTSPSSLLAIPAAGVFETDLGPSIKRTRLYYTDSVPLRHSLAYTDDVNFTNDAVARPNGGIGFYGDTGSINFLIAKLDGEVIGTSDFAVLLRFLYPATTAAQINYGLFSLTSSTTGTTGPYDLTAFMAGTAGVPELRVGIRNEAAALTGATWIIPDMTRAGGKVIDLLISRVAGVLTIYLDGVNVTPVPSGANYQSSPIANAGAILRFHLGSMHTSVMPAHTDFYRVSLFNRGFATEDEAKFLSRYGIASADLWGSTVDLLAGAGGFESLTGWTLSQPAGSTVALNTTPSNVYSGTAALMIASGVDGAYAAVSRAAVLGAPGKRMRYDWKAKRDAASADPTSVQVSYGGGGFVKNVQITSGTAYGTYTSEAVYEVPAVGLAFARTSGQVSKTFFIDGATARQVGALVDFDLGVGRGTVVPDRSGRYPGVINGSNSVHLVPVPVGSGDGIYSNTQKFQGTVLARDNDTKDVVHNLGTTGITVEVWDSAGRRVGISATRKAGNEANAVTLGFNAFGSPSVDQSFQVVITG